MVVVNIGEHYTYEAGDGHNIIMFVTSKEKYIGEEVYYFDTITLNTFLGEVFEKDFEVDFFESKHIRKSTKEEIQQLRSKCPVNKEWVEKKMEEIIKENWIITQEQKPEIVFDPDEPLERGYLGVFDSIYNLIIFRSEFLILCDLEKIENVLKHELCHWYLFVTGQPHRDSDERFAKEIIRLGVEDTLNLHNLDALEAYEKAKRSLGKC